MAGRYWLIAIVFLFLFLGLWTRALGNTASGNSVNHCTTEIAIDGAITAATDDFLERGLKLANTDGCESVLLTINTPGGSLETTRRMVERILASPKPILCVVAPEGGHAGSAGALLMLACHVSGALPATNIGAATPIISGGAKLPDDLRNKLVEDTKSWAVSLAKFRGRSEKYAEAIVTEAKAYDAEAALKMGAIELKATSIDDFLKQANGRKVSIGSSADPLKDIGSEKALILREVVTGERKILVKDWREKLLSLIADPEFSYLLFLAAIGLLYFEITHPGAIAPGVVGGILLITSLIAFHKLEVQWGAVGLMLLGVGFLIAEAFVPSFGALGVGGIVSLLAGSVLLYDPANGGLALSPWLALGAPGLMGGGLLALAIYLFRSRWRHGESLSEAGVLGAICNVERIESDELNGSVTVRGEIWSVAANEKLAVGDQVKVLERQGMKLKVKKV